MKTDTNAIFLSLVDAVSSMDEVASVGKTGEPELPRAGEGDIDVCVYCDSIPRLEKRGNALRSLGLQSFDLGASCSQHWGVVDFADLNGIETYLMYFTLDETVQSVDSIANGERLEKEDHYFYPTGRLAMLRDINILFDRHGFLTRMKTNLCDYPVQMADKLIAFHLDQLRDVEDLERAVLRNDPLFFHFALDLALDHFLQALFAMNRRYFPSRKRSIELLETFARKPADCGNRLLKIVELGGSRNSIPQAYSMWRALAQDLAALCS